MKRERERERFIQNGRKRERTRRKGRENRATTLKNKRVRYTEEDNYGTSMQTDRKDLMGVRCRERSQRDIIQIRELYRDAFRDIVNGIRRGCLYASTERD